MEARLDSLGPGACIHAWLALEFGASGATKKKVLYGGLIRWPLHGSGRTGQERMHAWVWRPGQPSPFLFWTTLTSIQT
jgi:hypothetical protein